MAKKLVREKVKSKPMQRMNKLEVSELSMLLKNEELIRNNLQPSYQHKSKIYLDFVKVLKEYREKKNDNNN